MSRAEYNYFLSEDGSGCGAIRVTDIYGERLTVSGLAVRADVVQPTRFSSPSTDGRRGSADRRRAAVGFPHRQRVCGREVRARKTADGLTGLLAAERVERVALRQPVECVCEVLDQRLPR
jgi:hypothetical protein